MTSTFLYGAFRANERVCLDIHHFAHLIIGCAIRYPKIGNLCHVPYAYDINTPSKNRFASIFLTRLARSCTKSCTNLVSLALKMKLFLQDIKNLARILHARKNCKIIFFQDLIKILQENYLANFSCKILAGFFTSCKKSFIFSARLTRFCARSCKNNTCKICIFLARRFLLHAYYYYYVSRNKICDCLSENPPSSHLLVFREIPF